MVNHIKLDGKTYPVRLSYFVLKHFRLEKGRDLNDFDDISDIEPVLYYAMVAGCKAEKMEMPFSREEMEFVIDENFTEIIKQLPVLLKDLGQMAEGENKEAKKKK
jgi:hypothetical protein